MVACWQAVAGFYTHTPAPSGWFHSFTHPCVKYKKIDLLV